MAEDSGTPQDGKIYELTEVYDERNGQTPSTSAGKNDQHVVVVDGRGYDRAAKLAGNPIHDLTDVIEDDLSTGQLHDMVMDRVSEIVEKIMKEVIPEIAERVIKEEIDKIRKLGQAQSEDRNE